MNATATAAQRTLRRHVVTATLVTDSPLHIGTGVGDSLLDLPAVRDGLGRLYIPGTSLTGCLRESVRRDLGDAETHWFGDASLATGASRVVVLDCVALAGDLVLEKRSRIAIERESGVALPGALFSQEFVPAGTQFACRLEVEEGEYPALATRSDDGELLGDPGIIDLLVGRMLAGVRVGRGTMGGAGVVRLEGAAQHEVVELASRKGFLAFLRGSSSGRLAVEPVPDTSEVLSVSLSWRPRTAVMSSIEVTAAAVDRAPLTAASAPGTVRLVLPGTSIRGALRARAEFIVASLNPEVEAAAQPTVFQVFGAVGKTGKDKKQLGRRSALRVADCRHEVDIDESHWRAIVRPDAPVVPPGLTGAARDRAERVQERQDLAQALEEVPGLGLVVADRVAIDRWTGGAAEGLLYSLLEPHQVAETGWQPIRLELDLRRIDDSGRLGAVGLMLLVVRELMAGWVPIGFGANRGLGHVEVTEWSWSVGAELEQQWGALVDWEHTRAMDPDSEPPGVVSRAIEEFVQSARAATPERADHG